MSKKCARKILPRLKNQATIPILRTRAAFRLLANSRRMVINLCLGIYIAQAEDEEFSVVDAV